MFWAASSGAADGSGLAGGAIVLGYGVIGALIAASLGLVLGLRLPNSALPKVASVLGMMLLIAALLVAMRIRNERLANLDPPEAYKGIPSFSLTLERTDRADPVLAKMVSVDSNARTWMSRLPDDRECSSQASAASLRKAVGALQDFLQTTGGRFDCDGDTEAIVTWRIMTEAGWKDGSIRLDSACLVLEPKAQFLLFVLQQVTLASNSPVKCK